MVPLLPLRLFPTASKPCCGCGCNASPTSSSPVTSSKRWFGRVRRRPSADGEICIEKKKQMLDTFDQLYLFALEELAYAIESQGSIYYAGDLAAAQDALGAWNSHYEDLLKVLNETELKVLEAHWEEAHKQINHRLLQLPLAHQHI